ncbi:MAG: hypothetical protein KatS3mg049_2475 [Caldilinea sp.]|nr:MAG: hypothetical protein KatS3mg049_2475 [Caldilinea sp.]
MKPKVKLHSKTQNSKTQKRCKNGWTNLLPISFFSITVAVLLVTATFLAFALYFQNNSSAVRDDPSGAGQPVTINSVTVPPLPTLDASVIARGEQLYAQYCAACHGVNLEGAPNWRVRLSDGSLPAPPHDSSGHTWHHPDPLLIAITRNGGDPAFNSHMPAFGDQLTDDEIDAILTFIKSRWGEKERQYQWWITVMNRKN